MQTPQELPLRVIWLNSAVSHQGRIFGPVSMGSWKHHKPALLLSIAVERLGVVDSGDTFSRQRVYWVQGERFLDVNKTYEDQLVRRNDVLIVTDEENDKVIIALASKDIENIQNKRTGARDWNSLSDEIRHGR